MPDIETAREHVAEALRAFANRYQLGDPPYTDSVGAEALQAAVDETSPETITAARGVLRGYNLYGHQALIGDLLTSAEEALADETPAAEEEAAAEPGTPAAGPATPSAPAVTPPASGDGLDEMSFKDLQATATEKGLKAVGVTKAALIESIREASK